MSELKQAVKKDSKRKGDRSRQNQESSARSQTSQNEANDQQEQEEEYPSYNFQTYEEAWQHCQEKLNEYKATIEHLCPEEQQRCLQGAEAQCKTFLEQFENNRIAPGMFGDTAVPQDMEAGIDQPTDPGIEDMTGDQFALLQQQEIQARMAQFTNQFGQDGVFAGTDENGQGFNYFPGNMESPEVAEMQHQQLQMLQQLFVNPQQMMALAQQQQKILMREEIGNQLRIFASKMFKQLSQSQKKKLESKAKHYLDQLVKDHKKMQRQTQANGNRQQDDSQPLQTELESMINYEFQADPEKYLNEIENQLKKHKQLQGNLLRFTQKEFENNEQDQEQEQICAQFIFQKPREHAFYLHLIILYTQLQQRGDEDNQKQVGENIFNLIMPLAKSFDSRLVKLIPQTTLVNYRIEYDEEGQIKSWSEIPQSSGYTGSYESSVESGLRKSVRSADGNSGSSSDSDLSGPGSYDAVDPSQIMQNDSDPSGLTDQQNLKQRKLQSKLNGPTQQGNQILPQMGKTKQSLINQVNFHYPNSINSKSINKHELKSLDNLYKSIRDTKDWDAFCKLLQIYFDGVLSWAEFYMLFHEKFQNKLRQDVRDEIEKLLPSRNQNRRAESNLLKAWNDTENQTFEKIPDSSYYRIDDDFPMPTCTMKMLQEVYWNNLNDAYLSLATGSENKKFRNTYEEKIYTNEDKLYEHDTQIDNFERSYRIVCEQCDQFEGLSEADQNVYKFPVQKLSPYRFYWDLKFKRHCQDQYFKVGKILKSKEMAALKKAFNDKLEFLRNQKNLNITDIKDSLKKNFTKSLDHKSFQFKDFMKKFQQKQLYHMAKIKQIAEENQTKKRFAKNDYSLLFGSGEQPDNSDYRFYNTFGKDFGGKFNTKRIADLEKSPDHPIDMRFMDDISSDQIFKHQAKFPQARFLMNDPLIFEITLKLVIQNVKIANSSSLSDKSKQIKLLRFFMEKFLAVKNFEQIELQSDYIQPLPLEMVDILMNSAVYYQKKYEGELEPMCEVFSIDGLSTKQVSKIQSPLKQQYQIAQNQINITVDQLDLNQNSCRSPRSQDDNNEGFESKSAAGSRQGGHEIEVNSQVLGAQGARSSSEESNKTWHSKISGRSQAQSARVSNRGGNLKKSAKVSQRDPDSDKESMMSESKLPNNVTQKFKQMETHDETKDLTTTEQLENSLFVPEFTQKGDVADEAQYKLFYGSANVHMFLTFFYSVYERILKAQELVKSKVDQDFKDDFSKKEWSTKFKTKMQTLIDERFQYFIKSVLTAIGPYNILDPNKYEDVARELLGNEAHLLFQVDKLVNNCIKHLDAFHKDNCCKATQELFLHFEQNQVKNERNYLAKFNQVAKNCSRQTVSSITPNAGANKDPPLNQQAFRFMYSPVSNILTIHYITLNPFFLPELKQKAQISFPSSNGGISHQEQLKYMKSFTVKDQEKFYDHDDCNPEVQEKPKNRVTSYSQPIFLRRNLRKMKDARKNASKQVYQKNGLVSYMVPLLQQLQFENHTEDVIIVQKKPSNKAKISERLGKRSAKKEQDVQKMLVAQDLAKRSKCQQLMEERFNKIQKMQKTQYDDHQYVEGLYSPQNPQGLILQKTTIIDANSEQDMEQGMQEEG